MFWLKRWGNPIYLNLSRKDEVWVFKHKRVITIGLFLVCFFGGYGCRTLALENDVGGNPANAGMGFTQVVNSLSFFANPAAFGDAKALFSMANTELYSSGVFYNYLEAACFSKSNWKISIGYESVKDKDNIDNSGYCQKVEAVGLSKRINPFFSLGINILMEQHKLFNETIRSCNSLNVGTIYGPVTIYGYNAFLGAKINNLAAQQKYKTKEDENPWPLVSCGLSINSSDNSLKYVMDLKEMDGLDFRCGFEYKATQSLFLRAGLNNGEPTLGLGISRTPFNIDYAYWFSGLGATQRIGFSVLF